jgi:chromosomal replication initiator protein
MQQDYQILWGKCLAVIKDIVPESAYKTWFLPIIPLAYEDKKVTIQVPSRYFYEYLEEKYSNVLKATLHRVFGTGMILNYRVLVGQSSTGGTVDSHIEKNLPVTQRMPAADSSKAMVTPFTQNVPQNFDSQLNTRYTFDNFFEGVSNKLARSAGESIATNPGKTTFNPLFLFGSSGVGKTHMCHAIGLRVRELHPEQRVLYVSSHLFRIQFTDAVRKNTTNDFLNFYQSLDVLLLDDIHELIGMTKTQNAFFHIFNNLHQLGKQLVLTSDKPPVELSGMTERLITRLKWGLTAEIARPDKELRRQILRSKIDQESLKINNEVFDFILNNVTENVRDMEGVLTSLMAHSLINNRDIDMALTRQIVSQAVRLENRQLSVEKILEVVCKYFNLEKSLIQTTSRKREIVQARQITMYLSKKYTPYSFSYIGKIVGGKDHATVLYACQTVKDQIDISKSFRSTVESIEVCLKN